jgi:hypothetical protein
MDVIILPRPKKNRKINTDDLITQLIEAVTDTYLHPPEGTADENGKMYLNLLAEEFSMTPIKVRKLLIASGAYRTPISEKINDLYRSGKTIKEIQQSTGLSAASISGYMPYQKTVYKLEVSTDIANRLRKYRERKAKVGQLAAEMSSASKKTKDLLWETLIAFENYPFKTATGLRYSYSVKGNELFVSRKEKSVTRASVNMAFEAAVRLQREVNEITGPKMLGCFGASYLYPIFIRIGVICDGKEKT